MSLATSPGAGASRSTGGMSATARDLALAVHPHPTLSETMMECAEVFYGHATHTLARKPRS